VTRQRHASAAWDGADLVRRTRDTEHSADQTKRDEAYDGRQRRDSGLWTAETNYND